MNCACTAKKSDVIETDISTAGSAPVWRDPETGECSGEGLLGTPNSAKVSIKKGYKNQSETELAPLLTLSLLTPMGEFTEQLLKLFARSSVPDQVSFSNFFIPYVIGNQTYHFRASSLV